MRCDELTEKIVQYMQDELNDEARQAFEKHVQDCESCRMELEHAREMDALLRQAAPRYWEEIEPSPGLLYRLENSGPWAEPKKSFSLKEWLFGPWQSRRIVTATVSAALVVTLILFLPEALILQEAPPPSPALEMAAPTTDGARGPTFSATPAVERGEMKDEDISVPVQTTMPMPVPAAATPPSVEPTPIPQTIFSFSGSESADLLPFEIRSSPWKLKWSATADATDRIIIRIIDSQTGVELGEVAGSFTSPGRMDNETLLYDKEGILYLSIEAASSTRWTVEVIATP